MTSDFGELGRPRICSHIGPDPAVEKSTFLKTAERGLLNLIFIVCQLGQAKDGTRGGTKRPNKLPSVRDVDSDTPAQATEGRTAGEDVASLSAGSAGETAIDMRLFRLRLDRLVPGKCYQVRFKKRRTWYWAFRWEKLWLAQGDLVGRVEDTAEVRPFGEDVMSAIDRVAETMAKPLEDCEGRGEWQYFVDRDVLDMSNALLGDDVPYAVRPSKQQISVFRAVRLAAAAKATPWLPFSEIAVGYQVTDRAGNVLFETFVVDEAVLYAHDNQIDCREGVAVVFADGSVRHGHELSLRPWLRQYQQ